MGQQVNQFSVRRGVLAQVKKYPKDKGSAAAAHDQDGPLPQIKQPPLGVLKNANRNNNDRQINQNNRLPDILEIEE